MNYKKAIYFKNGDVLTITEKEAETIKAGLRKGSKWVEVQTEFISADHIGRIGDHHATAQMKKLEEADTERILKIEGKGNLVEARQKLIKEKTVKRLKNGDPTKPQRGMSEEESARGDVEYYIGDDGEKHYI